ncbi:hypothetical protein RB614_15770 [Phytohabitans sp. ZYX-F-186]|uniref:Uncharacterized protein n=1 Tax=Phytohabitans maris TaxID=3071409 RepID=A0ABU0ZFY5_9ACTN|nr:hypothetical protein [Phytohabitans sp. ZYX-F-186]MDQ7905970.1 hypothetical protein [Phytohabitans sp. ZYX-F-186]
MRDYTNLQWPEAPFGAEQRPFGQHHDMLAAFAVDWTSLDAGLLPVAAATVYLRVRRHGTAAQAGEQSLSIGFRATVIEEPAEAPHLLTLTDRALTRARRHAVILAGHHLDNDLTCMGALSTTPLRGAAGVLAAWANRTVKERGVALMIDTAAEARTTGVELDMPLDPVPESVPDCPGCAARLARCVLARCLAVGLTAAVHAGRYRWEGTFHVGDAIDRAAWDLLSANFDDAGHQHRHQTTHRAATPPRRNRR